MISEVVKHQSDKRDCMSLGKPCRHTHTHTHINTRDTGIAHAGQINTRGKPRDTAVMLPSAETCCTPNTVMIACLLDCEYIECLVEGVCEWVVHQGTVMLSAIE